MSIVEYYSELEQVAGDLNLKQAMAVAAAQSERGWWYYADRPDLSAVGSQAIDLLWRELKDGDVTQEEVSGLAEQINALLGDADDFEDGEVPEEHIEGDHAAVFEGVSYALDTIWFGDDDEEDEEEGQTNPLIGVTYAVTRAMAAAHYADDSDEAEEEEVAFVRTLFERVRSLDDDGLERAAFGAAFAAPPTWLETSPREWSTPRAPAVA